MTSQDDKRKQPKANQPERPRATPMFTAMHAPRYQRQIPQKEINAREQTNLICYVGGAHAR